MVLMYQIIRFLLKKIMKAKALKITESQLCNPIKIALLLSTIYKKKYVTPKIG